MSNEELFEIAKEARLNARCVISDYKVGAALLCASGNVYKGANVEMAEIPGLSNCAERVAFQNAIANGETEFTKILVVGGKNNSDLVYTSPCGVCRQYMIELNKNITIVTTEFKEGEVIFKETTPIGLLPDTFILEEQIKD